MASTFAADQCGDQFISDSHITELAEQSEELDQDYLLLTKNMRMLLRYFVPPFMPSDQQRLSANLRNIYSVSASLGFTMHQHLVAVARLTKSEAWQKKHHELWSCIRSHQICVGLATTHASSMSGPKIFGKRTADGFLIHGQAPWVCGYQIFDKLVVNFLCEGSLMVALVDFPKKSAPSNAIAVKLHPMDHLRSSQTVSLCFEDFFVSEDMIIEQKKWPLETQLTPVSLFRCPELGVAQGAIRKLRQFKYENIDQLKSTYDDLCKKLVTEDDIDELTSLAYHAHQLCHEAVRSLAIATGGGVLINKNGVRRMTQELLLLDVMLQSSKLKQMKLVRL